MCIKRCSIGFWMVIAVAILVATGAFESNEPASAEPAPVPAAAAP